ncbi:branched-chain amino acid transaminase [Simkania negevensis]|uniref:Branched-chain-amino-acid aminotransferase n=1 Tax=Simkania negevensis TaxID=83561 RepID=A0ABS3ASM3_9BACT|nr:branched-chain amino acid transaminase [Simkania negevensis]
MEGGKQLHRYCYFEGEIIESKDAKLGIASQTVQYGMTCFGGIRAYKQGDTIRLFRLKDHYRRLMDSTRIMGWTISLSYDEFEQILKDLIAKNKPDSSFYIRPFFYTTHEGLGPSFITPTFSLSVFSLPLGQYYDPTKGLRLTISSWQKFSDAAMPTKAKAGGCYLNSALATTEAKRSGFDDALLLDQHGFIVEASVANILVSYNDELYVPPASSDVLDGITMRTVIEILDSEGITVSRQCIDRSMVYSADELLLTGTAAQVQFAASVDNRPIGVGSVGKICQLLRERFDAIIAGNDAFSAPWIMEIAL